MKRAPGSGHLRVFSPRMLQAQVTTERALRLGSLLVLVVMFAGGWALHQVSPLLVSLLTVTAAVLWIATDLISGRIMASLPVINEQLNHNLAEAEATIALSLRQRPLISAVRLKLYHRMAILRHRQHRYHESALICQTLLNHDALVEPDVRANLLLMLAEARLLSHDFWGTYDALMQLHQMSLSLQESLQLLALQTRYEVICGHDLHALFNVQRKIELCELMPVSQCAAIHATLASAAQRQHQPRLAHWLRSRAELLAPPAQFASWDPTWIAQANPVTEPALDDAE